MGKEVYEVTQLVNSFLGAWSHPWEEWRRDLKHIDLVKAKNDGWPINPPDDDRDEEPRNLGQLLQLVRNAMAHGNLRFLRDPKNQAEIGKVCLWNERNGWRTWGITLTIEELRHFLSRFYALAEQLPEPRPRTVRHVKDKQVTKTRTVSIPNSQDLIDASRAYGHDRNIEPFDEIVEHAVRGFLADHGYLAPFRPFHITPIPFDDDGPTDVSINHDRYFAEWTLETLHGPKHRDTGKPDPPS